MSADQTQALPPRWYVVDKEGFATLCKDYDDAQDVAAESFVAWPHRGPHHVVQLVAAQTADAIQADINGLSMDLFAAQTSVGHLAELVRLHGQMETLGRWIVEALKVLDTIDPDDMEESELLMTLIKGGEMLSMSALAPQMWARARKAAGKGPACNVLRPWEQVD